jgi:exosome complex component RRP4
VRVAPYLIKRLKQHFHQLKDLGVDLILGCNGFIWISVASPGNKDNLQLPGSVAASESAVVGESPLQFEARERICRLANSVRVLGALGLLISPDSIMQTYEASLLWEVPVKDMLSADFYVKLAAKEAEQRSKR